MKEKVINTIVSCMDKSEDVRNALIETGDITQVNMNSITFIKMVVMLEIEFGFEFDDESLDYLKFHYVDSLVEYIDELIKKTENESKGE